MSYFPFFVEIQGEKCLVVGGGDVAYRKVRTLLSFGVNIRLVAREVCEAVNHLAHDSYGRLMLEQREFTDTDLEDVLFVIAATNDEACNRHIAQLCHQRKLLVNVVDDPEKCSFYFPALVKQGELVAGISSGGNSPVLAKSLRRELEEQIPGYYDQLNDALGALRPYMRVHIDTEAGRKECYQRIIKQSRKLGRALSLKEMKQIVEKGNKGEW